MDNQAPQTAPIHLRIIESADVPELLCLYNMLFPATQKTIGWWRWWYNENPAGDSFQVLAETGDREIVGMLGMSPVRIWYKGSILKVAQDSVGIVNPNYQGRGVFTTVANELHRLEALQYPFNFCFCNEKSYWAYRNKVGSIPGGNGNFYEKPAMLKKHRFTLRSIQQFDARHDRLWETVRDRLDIAQVRDAIYLNWRFSGSKMGKDYIIYDVFDGQDFFGYMIMQPFRDKMDLLDYCFVEGSGLGELDTALDILENIGYENGYQRVSFWVLDVHPHLIAILQERGYKETERNFYLLSRTFTPEPYYKKINDFSRWSYTAGDLELF